MSVTMFSPEGAPVLIKDPMKTAQMLAEGYTYEPAAKVEKVEKVDKKSRKNRDK